MVILPPLQVGDDDTTLREVGRGVRVRGLRCGRFHTMLLVADGEMRGIECEGTWGRWVYKGWQWVLDVLTGKSHGSGPEGAYEAVELDTSSAVL